MARFYNVSGACSRVFKMLRFVLGSTFQATHVFDTLNPMSIICCIGAKCRPACGALPQCWPWVRPSHKL